jgi:hypothetical protein
MMRVPHLVYSLDRPLCDFWFFGDTKERMKDYVITSEDNLEHKTTDNWEATSGDLFESVF